MAENCDDGRPPPNVHVATTPAPVVERAMLDLPHTALGAKDPLPARRPIDAAYIDTDGLVTTAHDNGVALTGPVPKDNQWQARTAGAVTLESFHRDWDRGIVIRPGRTWQPGLSPEP